MHSFLFLALYNEDYKYLNFMTQRLILTDLPPSLKAYIHASATRSHKRQCRQVIEHSHEQTLTTVHILLSY